MDGQVTASTRWTSCYCYYVHLHGQEMVWTQHCIWTSLSPILKGYSTQREKKKLGNKIKHHENVIRSSTYARCDTRGQPIGVQDPMFKRLKRIYSKIDIKCVSSRYP